MISPILNFKESIYQPNIFSITLYCIPRGFIAPVIICALRLFRRVSLMALWRTTDGGAGNRDMNAGISGDLAQHPAFDLRQAESLIAKAMHAPLKEAEESDPVQ